MPSTVEILSLATGPVDTNCYLVICTKTHLAAIIDPGTDCHQTILKWIRERHLVPTAILLTHTHWDHIADVAILKKILHVPIYVHPEDALNLKRPGADGLPCWIPIEAAEPDHLLDEAHPIQIGESSWNVLHTPGHSPGSVCLYSPSNKILISGDTLFKGSIGNISFPTSDPDKMWKSLDKLSSLPPDTIVYPGHGQPTSIGKENWLPRAQEIFG